MTTYNIETRFFPLVIESDEEILRDVLVTYRDQIEPQLRAVIDKSPNPKAVEFAKRMLAELENEL